MKSLRLLILTLLPAALFAGPVESKISAVTVYADRAVVTRTGSTELTSGTTELVFANLPQGLDDRSLQVSAKGTAPATILDVSAKRAFVDFATNPRVKQLEDELKGLLKQNRALDDRTNLLQAKAVSLEKVENAIFSAPGEKAQRLEISQVASTLTYLTEQKSKIASDQAELTEEREALQAKITATQNQLNELRGSAGRAFKNVTVRVSSTQAGNLDVNLSYTVPGASWGPNYDARVSSNEHGLHLNYFGIVHQNTGENWDNVALTLSTARPNLGGAAPTPTPWSLNIYSLMRPSPSTAALGAGPMEMNSYAEPIRPAPDAKLTREADQMEATLAYASIEAGATSASFNISSPATIPTDNSPQKIPVTSIKLETQPEYLTTPKLLTTAYLTSKVNNSSEYPLLAGEINVFLDGMFVATSWLGAVMPGEKFDLALGADEGISVKHKRVQRFTENTGLTNSGVRITYEYLITIQNNKKTAEKVVVNDQVPISRNEKIVVKIISPDVKTVKPDNEGTLKWTLDLKPGEKRELTVKFTVDYPKDVNVEGLDN